MTAFNKIDGIKQDIVSNRKNVVVNRKMKDYSKDAFVVKKNENARNFLDKNGVPEMELKK